LAVAHDDREREFTKYTISGKVDIESKVRGHLTGNKWGFHMDDGGFFKTRMEYYSRASDSQSALEYRLEIQGIQEYQETGPADNGFNGGDTAGFLWSSNQDFVFSELTPELLGNVTVLRFQARSQDGVLTIIGRIATEPFLYGLIIHPSQCKLDFFIDTTVAGWTWQLANPSVSKLAMIARLRTKTKVRGIQGSTQGTQVTFGADNRPGGAFIWAPFVTVNNNDATNATVVAGGFSKDDQDQSEDNWGIVFSFLASNPNHLEWDPIVGWNAGTSRLPCVFTLTLLALLGLFKKNVFSF